MNPAALDLVFPHAYVPAAMMVSLLSVWMLVGLFVYLNRYTKREYFTIWTAAWLFYALWLTLNLQTIKASDSLTAAGAAHAAAAAALHDSKFEEIIFILKQCCVAISAVFLLWGSLRFLGIIVRQRLLGLFMVFLLVWTALSPFSLSKNTLGQELPVFMLIGMSSMFGGVCFFRLRKKMPFVGAGMLSLGFMLWGIYLSSYPFAELYQDLTGAAFFIAAVLQLFIAVSMVVLVLEEARFNAERVIAEIATVRSEKEALQSKILSAEEQCRNLYDQVRLAAGLQTAYEELRRTQQVVVQQERLRALGQMASGIAHDINNALSPITAYSELLLGKRNIPPETTREYLQAINKSGVDIAHIVARMREFYRRREDSEPLAKVNINEIVNEVIGLTRPRWRDVCQREGVSINVKPEFEADMPRVMGDPSELREALINLIFNSLDAMPYGGTIQLITRSVNRPGSKGDGERALQIEVRDDGVGMDEKTRRRCLEPFFSTKIQRGGSGLGLAMVYGMMQRHDGTIDIESAPGKGTGIRLTFPFRTEAQKETNDSIHEDDSKGALRILCIDDERHVLQLLSDCLSPFGHRVTTAPNGQDGLELFRSAKSEKLPFQAVITDLGMPGFDGRQVARAIKSESPGTPVIMLTGWGGEIREGKENISEVDVVIEKPPSIQHLHETLLKVSHSNGSNGPAKAAHS
ncbi:MAG TPA: ATP-binding protein [Verrucomicrobiae bacterium]|jgi:signal transduction histidine kinase/CheY-like chemotaxis protein|nr:ATP-binding protein [Verrucomicrobiae bacterium]